MISYRDMTFCPRTDCAKFGPCERSLTDEVKRGAELRRLPISQFVGTPKCFEQKKDELPAAPGEEAAK